MDLDPRNCFHDYGSGSKVTFDSVNLVFPTKYFARLFLLHIPKCRKNSHVYNIYEQFLLHGFGKFLALPGSGLSETDPIK